MKYSYPDQILLDDYRTSLNLSDPKQKEIYNRLYTRLSQNSNVPTMNTFLKKQ